MLVLEIFGSLGFGERPGETRRLDLLVDHDWSSESSERLHTSLFKLVLIVNFLFTFLSVGLGGRLELF